MDFRSLCGNIDLPEEMQKEAICYYQSGGFDTVRPFVEGLRNMETESNARDKLNRLLDPDPKKPKCWLVCCLALQIFTSGIRKKG